jgi:hypothetical protein
MAEAAAAAKRNARDQAAEEGRDARCGLRHALSARHKGAGKGNAAGGGPAADPVRGGRGARRRHRAVLPRHGRGKTSIVEHFDIAYELEKSLEERGKADILAELRGLAIEPGLARHGAASRCRWASATPSGAPAPLSPTSPSPILLPDDLMQCEVSCTAQLAEAYRETGGNVVAIERCRGSG